MGFRPRIVLATLWPVLLSTVIGCVTFEGTSTQGIRQGIIKSTTFRVSDALYPGDRQRSEEAIYREIEGRDIGKLRAEVENARDYINAVYRHWRSDLLERFPSAKRGDIQLSAKITKLDQPIAQVNDHGQVEIDVRVLHALFRASLAAGLAESDDDAGSAKTLESRRIDIFLGLKQEVRNAPARSTFGDIWDTWREIRRDIDDDKPTKGSHSDRFEHLTDLSERVRGVDSAYRSTLLFLMGHELGHVALQHKAVCEGRAALELEADTFSAFLLARAAISQNARMQVAIGAIDLEALQTLQAANTFFQHGYDRIGFGPVSGSECPYPTPELRAQTAGSTVAAVIEKYQERDQQQLLIAQAKASLPRGILAACMRKAQLSEEEALNELLLLRARLVSEGLSTEQANAVLRRSFRE